MNASHLSRLSTPPPAGQESPGVLAAGYGANRARMWGSCGMGGFGKDQDSLSLQQGDGVSTAHRGRAAGGGGIGTLVTGSPWSPVWATLPLT